MKNITLSADEHLIEQARDVARAKHTTLNQAFRDWLADYTQRKGEVAAIDAIYQRLSYVDAGRKYARDEMNER